MNYSDKARLIPISDYLGVATDKIEVWIKSPFNPSEKTASFKIHTKNNVWFDHCLGVGGGIIDLVMMLNNCDFTNALSILSRNTPLQKSTPIESQNSNATKSQMEVKKVQTLQNKALIQYIEKRAINTEVAIKYLCEVYYQNNSKNYFALGFKNDSENYELRNIYFKGCIGSKDITTIKGIGNKELSIFEGFLDFLSALTYFKINEFKSDVIILNSVANKSKINDLLYSNEYSKIYLFLDNDNSGYRTKEEFYKANINCIDCSNIYKAHNDFNDFLRSKV
jgi:5S rRNA maturation endonuclease (ribonuclease M5)